MLRCLFSFIQLKSTILCDQHSTKRIKPGSFQLFLDLWNWRISISWVPGNSWVALTGEYYIDIFTFNAGYPRKPQRLCEFTRGYHLLSFRDINHGLQSSASYPSLISVLRTTWPSGKYLTYYLLLISWYIWIILYCCYIMLYMVYIPTTWIMWCISRYTLWVWVPKLFAKASLS